MSLPALSLLIVGAGGGLGKALVREALSRGARVSVLVRSAAKYSGEAVRDTLLLRARAARAAAPYLGIRPPCTAQAAELPNLAGVHEGSGSDAAAVAAAASASGASVVLGCLGGDGAFARGIAEGAVRAGVHKVVGVAGATNLMDDDGVTPLWIKWAAKWPPAESAYKAHGEAIAAYRAVAAANPAFKYTVFCPPYMAARGAASTPRLEIIVNRPGADFISFEDAAWAMLEAAISDKYDNSLITAGAAPAAKKEL